MYPKQIDFLNISLAPSHYQPEICKKTWEKSSRISRSLSRLEEFLRHFRNSPCSGPTGSDGSGQSRGAGLVADPPTAGPLTAATSGQGLTSLVVISTELTLPQHLWRFGARGQVCAGGRTAAGSDLREQSPASSLRRRISAGGCRSPRPFLCAWPHSGLCARRHLRGMLQRRSEGEDAEGSCVL